VNPKSILAVFLGVSFFCVFTATILTDLPTWPATIPQVTAAGVAIWKGRTLEVVVQGIIILSGVISILLLLGPEKSRERSQ
jgi:hypothetical protein